MKRLLDRKTAEVARLQLKFEDTVRKRTSDLEEMNSRLCEVLRLKNDLILQLSHEVKTPIAALSGLVANLHDGYIGPVTDHQKEYFTRIKGISDRIKRLVTGLLQFAMAETGKIPLDRRPVEIANVAGEVLLLLQTIREERGVKCSIAGSMKGKVAYADPERLQQILLNLVHNAIKASPAGSEVVMEVQETVSELVVSVKDNGSGISPLEIPKILREPLYSGRAQGSGVGLYITRFLVELQGGRIWFETQEGKGTTVFFTLPRFHSPPDGRK
jgi:signal transduction histidine kinase